MPTHPPHTLHTPLSEFALIDRYFRRARPLRRAALGVGDDCALLPLPAGEVLAISTDTLVAGRHFFDDVNPAALGHKALAVNLSDLAASGAQPLACMLALTLPAVNDAWLAAFAQGLHALADASGCELIGGDTTSGPLSITITVLGGVPRGQELLRSGARVGDDIYASHRTGQGLGAARLALHLLQAQRGQAPEPAIARLDAAQKTALLHATRRQLEEPEPRTALGLALRGVASACMDISDGLQGDLRHILHASGVGATLYASAAAEQGAAHARAEDNGACGLLAASSPALHALGHGQAVQYALAGGDDYELLFTAPAQQRAQVAHIARQTGLQLTRIGRIEQKAGLRLRQADGRCVCIQANGFDHFQA